MDLAVINLAEFICESDAIEEIQNDPDVLMRQIQTGVHRMKKFGHQGNWGKGHAGAMLMLESLARIPINQRLDQKLICDVQSLITIEQHKKPGGHKLPEKFVGQYRQVNVFVGGRKCPESELVPNLMEELLSGQCFVWWQQNAKSQSPKKNIAKIADFHHKFLIIHPFADGNGRTTRALTYFLLRANPPYRPFIFTSADKRETYYRCFDDPTDSTAMRPIFSQRWALAPTVLLDGPVRRAF